MRFVNLTPHTVTLIDGGNRWDIEPTQEPLRVSIYEYMDGVATVDNDATELESDSLRTFPVYRTQVLVPEDVELPHQERGVGYIVSRACAEAFPHRDDFYIPHKTMRDDEGKIIGCLGLAQICTLI